MLTGVLPNIEDVTQRLINVIKIDDTIIIAQKTVTKIGDLFSRLKD